MLSFYTDGTYTIIAPSIATAMFIQKRATDSISPAEKWTTVPEDEPLTIWLTNDQPSPEAFSGSRRTRTVGEWFSITEAARQLGTGLVWVERA